MDDKWLWWKDIFIFFKIKFEVTVRKKTPDVTTTVDTCTCIKTLLPYTSSSYFVYSFQVNFFSFILLITSQSFGHIFRALVTNTIHVDMNALVLLDRDYAKLKRVFRYKLSWSQCILLWIKGNTCIKLTRVSFHCETNDSSKHHLGFFHQQDVIMLVLNTHSNDFHLHLTCIHTKRIKSRQSARLTFKFN